MGKLCAPIRDNDIKQLKATDNIVELLRLVFGCGFRGKTSSLKENWAVEEGSKVLKRSLKLCQFILNTCF